MAYPYTIANGQNPSGTKLQANFDYVLEALSGLAIKTGSTLTACHAVALAAPAVPFLAIPTDLPALLLYTGSATAGPDGNGWISLADWHTIS